jgi:AhpD family alkylhydroperoxidase
MEPRIDYLKNGRGAFEAMFGLEKYLAQSGLDHKLMTLIKLRASQINGCAFCIDMHWKDLRAAGESEQRLYGLDAWRESPYYIRSGSAPPSPGQKRSQTFSKVTFPTKSLRKHGGISRKRNSPI